MPDGRKVHQTSRTRHQSHSHIFAEDCFALKGGTAINRARDVAQFYKTHTIDEDFKRGFLALALGHNRPLHELLNPILQDHREIFAQQFTGMSDTPFTYEEHEATFKRLRDDLLAALTPDDKQNLINFISLEDTPNSFGIAHLSELPAIVWKQKNLATLRKVNPRKFAEQRDLLAKLLQ